MISNIARRAATVAPVASRAAGAAFWNNVEQAPADAIFGLTQKFKEDSREGKVNLGVGAYRDEDNKPYVLPVVAGAYKALSSSNNEYAPIAGLPQFLESSADFLFGDEQYGDIKGRVASVQTVSGTGALRVCGDFVKKFGPEKTVVLPTPTWANHPKIFGAAGLTETPAYPYTSPLPGVFDVNNQDKDFSVDLPSTMAHLEGLPAGTPVLLHACAHNPTGMDPSEDEWKAIGDIFEKKGLYAVFDSAYQGFATGDVDADAFAVRHFVDRGIPLMVCQSFSKNFGLYGHRTGALHVVCKDSDEAKRVKSQLEIIIRTSFSNPPIQGARIVSHVLGNPELRGEFETQLKGMADRISSMRTLMHNGLKKSKNTWDHIIKQNGMFAFTGLTPEQVDSLRVDHGVYMTRDGRVSIAGVNTQNVDHIVDSILAVEKKN